MAGLNALTPKDRIVELRGKHHVARLAGSTASQPRGLGRVVFAELGRSASEVTA